MIKINNRSNKLDEDKEILSEIVSNQKVEIAEGVDIAICRIRWAHEALHLSQAGFIRLFIDFGLTDFMVGGKSASTIKAYLQGNFPQNSPNAFGELVSAIAIFFHIETADFFIPNIGRKEFTDKIITRFKSHTLPHSDNSGKTQGLINEIANFEKCHSTTFTYPDMSEKNGNQFLTLLQKGAKKRLKKQTLFLIAMVVFVCSLAIVIFNQKNSRANIYPLKNIDDIQTATIDNRDIWLNSVETPMIVAYGSELCVSLKKSGFYASAFIEDRGFFFNQEGRILISAEENEKKCTGIWPGIPDAFNKTPYRLFIVVSETKIPITGDSDRRNKLPFTSYLGPIYIQRLN